MQKIMKRDEGFTGLEAAIVLIAFVVVAAVFSYVVLGAGFFSSQKAQESVYTGVEMASSSMDVIGDVYGLKNGTSSTVDTIRFTVGLAAGGTSVDFNTVEMVWATEEVVEVLKYNKNATVGTWNISDSDATTSVGLLLEGEGKFTIFASPTKGVGPYTEFNLEVRPSTGSSLGLKRTIPSSIDAVNILY